MTVVGNDQCGQITIVIAVLAIAGTMCTVNYQCPYPTSSFATVSPANAKAFATSSYTSTQSATGFVLNTGSIALTAGTYMWNYHVNGY